MTKKSWIVQRRYSKFLRSIFIKGILHSAVSKVQTAKEKYWFFFIYYFGFSNLGREDVYSSMNNSFALSLLYFKMLDVKLLNGHIWHHFRIISSKMKHHKISQMSPWLLLWCHFGILRSKSRHHMRPEWLWNLWSLFFLQFFCILASN